MDSSINIYADESHKKGKFFSSFYGGALLIGNSHILVKNDLQNVKHRLKINGEIKWSKINKENYDKYVKFIDRVFYHINENNLKIRLMFMQNNVRAISLDNNQKNNKFILLYYQFLKHAFGLSYYIPCQECSVNFYLDHIPESSIKVDKFKEFILYFNKYNNPSGLLKFSLGEINEINSHDYIILQVVDLLLGSIQAKLNENFKNTSTGTRPQKTRLKEKIYKHINLHIRNVYPRFNIGTSTSCCGDFSNRFNHKYRHWNFTPKNNERNNHYEPKNLDNRRVQF